MAVNQLKAGAILSYAVLGLNSIVGLLYTPYMIRMMGQSEFGLYSLVASVIAYLTILDLGFGNAIIRYTARFRAERKTDEQYSMFGMFLVLYSIIGVIAFTLGFGLYLKVDIIFGNTMTTEELRKANVMILIMVFNIAISFPFSVFGAINSAYEDFVFQKVVQLVRIALNTFVMIILLKLGYRAIGMVILATVLNLITLFLNYWYCIYKIRIKLYFKKFQWGFLKEVAIYSFYIFLNVLMDRIYWSSGQFVLGAIVGTSAVAIFAVAIQLQQMYMNFSSAISGVFLPKVTAMTTRKQSEEAISELFIRTGRIQYIIMAFILSGFILFGKQFIVFWAGTDYSETYVITLLFFIPLTVPLIQNLGITILQARNQMKFRSVVYIIIALISLGLQIPLAQRYGGLGCAIGISIALIAGQIVTMNIYYQRRQGINIIKFWKEIGKMTLAPLVVGIITYWILNEYLIDTIIELVLSMVLFSIIYLSIVWKLSMNQYERDLISTPVKRIMLKITA